MPLIHRPVEVPYVYEVPGIAGMDAQSLKRKRARYWRAYYLWWTRYHVRHADIRRIYVAKSRAHRQLEKSL